MMGRRLGCRPPGAAARAPCLPALAKYHAWPVRPACHARRARQRACHTPPRPPPAPPAPARARLLFEVVDAVVGAVGAHHVGIRLSPFNTWVPAAGRAGPGRG
jgi:hypothetical protein